MTGFPFTPLIGSNRSGDGDTRNPDRVSINPSFTGSVIGKSNQWYNPAAFVLPTPGTYGNIGRGTLTGPGLANVDLSLFKNTAVSEKTTMQFRAEFFNILNRSNFGPTQHDRVFRQRHQSLCRSDHDNGNSPSANPTGIKANILTRTNFNLAALGIAKAKTQNVTIVRDTGPQQFRIQSDRIKSCSPAE